MKTLIVGAALSLMWVSGFAANPRPQGTERPAMTRVAAGAFDSVLPVAPGKNRVQVASFEMDAVPVTNGQFAAFVAANPKWRRDRVSRLLADPQYLSQWQTPTTPVAAERNQPVTRVSWYAARAYCDSRGTRLPTWYEWEWAAAANESSADARNDPRWTQQILAWYSQPAGALPDVGSRPANVHGVRDLHGVVWEWVEDYNSLLVAGDNRQQAEADDTRFCGPGALTMEQKEQYATLMRIAMLSSLRAEFTTATMGFRCVR